MSYNNGLLFTNASKVLFEKRYCKQEGFSIIACAGINKKKYLNYLLEVKNPSFEITEFPCMEESHYALILTTNNIS